MRTIDADMLMDRLVGYHEIASNKQKANGISLAIGIVATTPTIDAVEVVRCRECKHWICNPNTEEWGKCKWISDEQFDVVMNDDDFCSYGEREDE